MKWHKATNKQLEIIFNHESDLPNHLLVGLVTEMITRKLFDGMIICMAKKLMSSYDRDEVLQAAYIGIYQLAKIFKPKKIDFKSMCYIAIERRLKTIIINKYQKKNLMNAQALNNEIPVMKDSMNIEKEVIRKITIQEKLSRLTDKQFDIITRFLQGYSLKWIGEHVYNQDSSAIRYQFKLALQKMNIDDFEIGRGYGGLKGA